MDGRSMNEPGVTTDTTAAERYRKEGTDAGTFASRAERCPPERGSEAPTVETQREGSNRRISNGSTPRPQRGR
jgi:hypothetical protein